MLDSLSISTINQYNTTYRHWWDFCERNDFSPFDGNPYNIISFLQYLLETSSNGFGSFNCHRSALSLIMPNDIGNHPHIRRFLKGVYRKRPPTAKYDTTWDPSQVLDYLRVSTSSELKPSSMKLITLLALSSGQRMQTLSLIRCSNIHENMEGIKIFIPDRTKTSGPGKFQPFINLPYFKEEPRLCTASLLKKYLLMTKDARQNDFLFITYKSPHRTASKQTLSRWVKETLKASGICESYKTHSTRHASTSDALRKVLSLEIIRRSAGWSSSSLVFNKFYNRPLAETDSFMETVFK